MIKWINILLQFVQYKIILLVITQNTQTHVSISFLFNGVQSNTTNQKPDRYIILINFFLND